MGLTSFVQEANNMITKESLQKAKDTVNEALLKVKQSYSNSPSSKKVIFVVEGKDDIPYYGTKADEYIPEGWKLIIIPAKNRKKVVEAYRGLDWSTYSKQKVLFFIDRDLSDYTDEDTPVDSNVYVTSKYAIENEICTLDTFIKALKYYYGLIDIDETDEKSLEQFYNACWGNFWKLSEPIMAQILYWKLNGIQSNYANFNMQNIFEIKNAILQRKQSFISDEEIIKELFKQSGIYYTSIDISAYRTLLNAKHTPDEYIRGKYVLAFFAKVLTYISHNSSNILPSKKKAKDSLGIGYESIIPKLCGIMKSPKSLNVFFNDMNKHLQQNSA